MSDNIKTNGHHSSSNNRTYDVADYTRLSEVEAILNAPDVYIGSDKWSERYNYFYDDDSRSIVCRTTTIPHAMEKCFEEVVQNAGDNYAKSIKDGVNAKNIIVMMDNQKITVKNFGNVIPLGLNQYGDCLVPDMIFSQLHSGTNLDKKKKRKGAGKNGLGVKLVNIFSKYFKVEIFDASTQKYYTRTWKDNMSSNEDFKFVDHAGYENYVIVSYILDFERFGVNGYTREFFDLFKRICIDLANTWRVEVVFNNESLKFNNSLDHAKLYFPNINNYLHFQIPSKEGNLLADVVIIDTPRDNQLIVYTNSTLNIDGGTHLNSLMKAVANNILSVFKNEYLRKKKKMKGKLDDLDGYNFPLSVKDVKNTISIIADFYYEDPTFTSQAKVRLSNYFPEITIDQSIFTPVAKWSIMERLEFLFSQNDDAILSTTDGVNRRFSGVRKLVDANEAGKKERSKCTLVICEGDSAMTYVRILIDLIENGLNYWGGFPIRGKILNVINATPKQLLECKEIANIKHALGLQEGVDYSRPENYSNLRYGRVMILTDADLDGHHIKGLLYTFFLSRFPSLFQLDGFFIEMALKVLKIKKGSEIIGFHNNYEYNLFIRDNPEYAKIKPSWFKGLGSSNKDNIKNDFKTVKQLVIVMDEDGPRYINLAFNKTLANKRKMWLESYRPRFLPVGGNIKRISDFADIELIEYSIANNIRSIPKYTDGLKLVQRKIAYSELKVWRNGESNKEIKTASFQSKAGDICHYHHTPSSMNKAIATMTYGFVGSNNMRYFFPEGQFGSRNLGGNDKAAERYTSIRPEWWIKYVYRSEDNALFKYVIDEGCECEPETLYPILPMSLINGVCGVGTGYSTFIPNHNPLDIVEWLEYKIKTNLGVKNLEKPQVYPWYRGFNGIIELTDKKSKQTIIISRGKSEIVVDDYHVTESSGLLNPLINGVKEDSSSTYESSTDDPETENEDDELLPIDDHEEVSMNSGNFKMVTSGYYEIINNVIHIRELPIGRWTQPYIDWLNYLGENNKITDFKLTKESGHDFIDHPQFEIYGFSPTANVKNLKLVKSYGMTNMVLLDEDNKPVKFNSVEHILEKFYEFRISIYAKRKEYIIDKLKNIIISCVERINYIKDIARHHKLEVRNRPKHAILADMDRLGHKHYLYEGGEGQKKVGISELSEDTITDLTNKFNKLVEELKDLDKTAPEEIWLREIKEFKDAYMTESKVWDS